MTTYTKKAVKGASITLLMSVLAALIAYVTRIVLARNLGPADYGLFSSVLTFILFFLFFRDLGLSSSLVKYIVEFRIHGRYDKIKTAITGVLSFQFASSLLFGLVFLALSGFLAQNYFKDPRAQTLIILLTVYVLFSIFFIVLKGIFNGFQRMFLFSSIEFAKNAIILLIVFVFFKLGFDIYAPVLAYVLVCPLLFLIYIFSAAKTSQFFSSTITDFRPITKQVVLFGIPLFATAFAGKIIGYIDTLMLTYFRPLSEVGVYNVVLPSALVLLFFGRSISSIVFPISSELWEKKDYKKLVAGVHLLHKYAFVLFIPVIFTVFSFPEFFLELFFGAEYVSGAVSLQILLVGMLIFIVAMMNNTIISAIGKPKIIAKITILAAVTNIVLNLILIPNLGINGAAMATAVSYALVLVLTTAQIKKYLPVKLPFLEWSKQAFTALLFIGIIYLLKGTFQNPWLDLVVSASCAGAVYILLLFVLKIIDLKEVNYYRRLLRRS